MLIEFDFSKNNECIGVYVGIVNLINMLIIWNTI